VYGKFGAQTVFVDLDLTLINTLFRFRGQKSNTNLHTIQSKFLLKNV